MEDERKKILLESNLRLLDHGVKIQGEVVREHERSRERAVRYTYQIITALGLVAGFGFTAISSVKLKSLFIIGEFLLFYAMAVGMRFVKRAFVDDSKIYAEYIKKLGDAIDKRTKISSDEPIDRIAIRMKDLSQEELKIFNDESKNIDSDYVFRSILYLFLTGGVLLLFSFLDLKLGFIMNILK